MSDDIQSQIRLIQMLMDVLGLCSEEDFETVLKILNRNFEDFARSEHPSLFALRAHMPQTNLDSAESDVRFNTLMQKGAAAGDPQAQYEHGCRLWEDGQFSAAVKLYKQSAKNGFPASQYCYGLALLSGEGVEKSEAEGLRFIELAAGRLYTLAIECLIGIFENDRSENGLRKLELYSEMLEWSKVYG